MLLPYETILCTLDILHSCASQTEKVSLHSSFEVTGPGWLGDVVGSEAGWAKMVVQLLTCFQEKEEEKRDQTENSNCLYSIPCVVPPGISLRGKHLGVVHTTELACGVFWWVVKSSPTHLLFSANDTNTSSSLLRTQEDGGWEIPTFPTYSCPHQMDLNHSPVRPAPLPRHGALGRRPRHRPRPSRASSSCLLAKSPPRSMFLIERRQGRETWRHHLVRHASRAGVSPGRGWGGGGASNPLARSPTSARPSRDSRPPGLVEGPAHPATP